MGRHPGGGRFPLEEALRLLRETRLEICEISDRLGYSHSAVTVMVKQAMKMTPSQYRQQFGWWGQRLTPERVEAIVGTYVSGGALTETAERHGVDTATVKAILEHRGIALRPPPRPHRKVSDEDLEEFERRYKAGESCVAIAADHGLNEVTVRRYLEARGVPRRLPPTWQGMYPEMTYAEVRGKA